MQINWQGVFPAATTHFHAAMFAELADEPSLMAIKESSENVRRITDIKNACGDRYVIFFRQAIATRPPLVTA
jgi:dihydrodipicolinate synthase/N-acetylneuraminate lyase